MKEDRVSKAYAQTIIDLGIEAGVNTPDELTKLTEVINENNNLETLLFSDVFTIEEKSSVLSVILEKMGLSKLVKNFLNFLLQEKRIGLFPLIYKDVIVIDDDKKGFLRGTIEGTEDDISPEFVSKIKTFIRSKIGKNTELTYVKNSDISAGCRVTVGDLQLDASLDNQLSKLKDSILES